MMRYVVVLLALLTNSGICRAQDKINFEPKQLYKVISRIYKSDNLKIVELENNSELVADPSCEKYFKISNSILLGYVYLGRVKTCRAGLCSSSDKIKNHNFEFFDYFILFDTLAKVLSVNIFNYEATHGQEITVRSWLNQFVGFDGSEKLEVGKNIDAISGATISVYQITEDVSSKTDKLREYLLKGNRH